MNLERSKERINARGMTYARAMTGFVTRYSYDTRWLIRCCPCPRASQPAAAKSPLPPPLGWNAKSIRQKNGELANGFYTSGASLFTAAAKVLRIAMNQLGNADEL